MLCAQNSKENPIRIPYFVLKAKNAMPLSLAITEQTYTNHNHNIVYKDYTTFGKFYKRFDKINDL